MRKTLSILSLLASLWPVTTARAAFVSCQDAKNYGENSARLFVGQTFARIACDGDLLERVHLAFDRVLSRQVLRTSDGDDVKLCFYEGMFEGLTEELRSRYSACDEDPRFACVSGETLSRHAGSLLSAMSLSLSAPSDVQLDALGAVFQAAQAGGPLSICSPEPELCESALLSSLCPAGQSSFADDAAALSALLCVPFAED